MLCKPNSGRVHGIPKRGKSTCKDPEMGENKSERLAGTKSWTDSGATLMSWDFIPEAKGSQVQCRPNSMTHSVLWCKTITELATRKAGVVRTQGEAFRGPDQLTCFFHPTRRPKKAPDPWEGMARAPGLRWGWGGGLSTRDSPMVSPHLVRKPLGSKEPVITNPGMLHGSILALDTSWDFNKHLLNWNELSRQSLRRYKFCYWRRLTVRRDNGLKSR